MNVEIKVHAVGKPIFVTSLKALFTNYNDYQFVKKLTVGQLVSRIAQQAKEILDNKLKSHG